MDHIKILRKSVDSGVKILKREIVETGAVAYDTTILYLNVSCTTMCFHQSPAMYHSSIVECQNFTWSKTTRELVCVHVCT